MSPTPKSAKPGVAGASSSPPAIRYFFRRFSFSFIRTPEGLGLVALRAGWVHPLRKLGEVCGHSMKEAHHIAGQLNAVRNIAGTVAERRVSETTGEYRC